VPCAGDEMDTSDLSGEVEADSVHAKTQEQAQSPAMMAGAGTGGKDGAFLVAGSAGGEASVPPAVAPPQIGLNSRWVANCWARRVKSGKKKTIWPKHATS
jgi:hypothetical protein